MNEKTKTLATVPAAAVLKRHGEIHAPGVLSIGGVSYRSAPLKHAGLYRHIKSRARLPRGVAHPSN